MPTSQLMQTHASPRLLMFLHALLPLPTTAPPLFLLAATPPPPIFSLSLHDALPISMPAAILPPAHRPLPSSTTSLRLLPALPTEPKSTSLNTSRLIMSQHALLPLPTTAPALLLPATTPHRPLL